MIERALWTFIIALERLMVAPELDLMTPDTLTQPRDPSVHSGTARHIVLWLPCTFPAPSSLPKHFTTL